MAQTHYICGLYLVCQPLVSSLWIVLCFVFFSQNETTVKKSLVRDLIDSMEISRSLVWVDNLFQHGEDTATLRTEEWLTDEQVKVSKGKERCVGEERMLVRRGTQGRVTVLCFGEFLSHVQNNRNPIFLFIGYIYFTLCAWS